MAGEGTSIRVAEASERIALEALQTRASLANPGDRQALLANPDAIALPVEQIQAGYVFVAEVDGELAGFAAILPRQDGDMDLDGLFVEPERWRQGIGKRLVEHCTGVAKIMGSRVLHVVGNPHAEVFYARCGFERFGTAETRFGSASLLRKGLRP
jgi:GNAT superfamily N-acetyltransferase